MSAYDAPSGSVYEWNGIIFVVLDGHRRLSEETDYRYRRAFNLLDGRLTYFGAGSGWDQATRIA